MPPRKICLHTKIQILLWITPMQIRGMSLESSGSTFTLHHYELGQNLLQSSKKR